MEFLERFLIRISRLTYHSLKFFTKNRCLYSASSLSFYSVATIIPLLAILLGAASYFKVVNHLEDFLLINFSAQQDVIISLIETARQFLDMISGKLITISGIIVTVWVLFRMLLFLEHTLNDIWQVEEGRSWSKRIVSYPLVIFMGPILVMMFLSAGISFLTEIKQFLITQPILEPLIPMLTNFDFFGLANAKITPHLMLWIMLFEFYVLLPNKKVEYIPALIGSLVATLLFIVVQVIYIYLQINITKYNTIYGSFAAIPFLLISIHWSWSIILYGSQLAYSVQETITNSDH